MFTHVCVYSSHSCSSRKQLLFSKWRIPKIPRRHMKNGIYKTYLHPAALAAARAASFFTKAGDDVENTETSWASKMPELR